MTHAPNDYALVIGIDHYPKWANGKKSLKGAINDAVAFHKWLTNPNGGGLIADNARLVLSTEQPVSPLQQNIDDEFKIIRERSRDRPRRRFYFYFSGHGHSPAMSKGEQALCLANWSAEDQGAALQLESYLNASVGCLGFEEGIFLLDCCRVREATPLGKTSDLECGDPKLGGRHHVTFYASEHYTPGYENDSEEPHGFFTQALLAILNKGVIEAVDLGKRLSQDVSDLAKPKSQTARTSRFADRDIFLGPPGRLPPQPSADGGPPGERAHLSVSLNTGLTNDPSPQEPPAPTPGEIAVYQADAVLGTGRGNFSALLPLGKYRVRIAHGEAIESHEIDLTGDKHFTFFLPRRISAAPLSSTIDKREIITDPIVKASRSSFPGNRQSIFIANRGRNGPFDGRYEGQFWIQRQNDLHEAIAGAHTIFPAHEGMYELGYRSAGSSAQRLSVPVAKDWDTQVFVVEDLERPVLERVSIFMQPAGKGFDPSDRLIDAFELALSDLVTGGPGPDPATLDDLLWGKFRNPLFGLVGAHFLVRELRFAKKRMGDRYHLLDTVIENMGRLLGENNPDVAALHIVRTQLQGESPAVRPPPSMPLLRTSFLTFIDATADAPKLFGRQFDAVALGLVADSPWTCWREQRSSSSVNGVTNHEKGFQRYDIEMQPSPRMELLKGILEDENFRVFSTFDGRSHRLQAEGDISTTLDFTSVARLATVPDWVVDAVRAEIDQSNRAEQSTRGEQSTRTEQPLHWKRLVRRLRLPRGLLEQAERIVRKESAPDHAVTPTETKKAKPIGRAA